MAVHARSYYRALAVALVACTSSTGSMAAKRDVDREPETWVDVLSVPVWRPPLDLLFVVEDAPGMAYKQQQVAAALPTFFDRLTRFGPVSLQVGVITTDMGTSSVRDEQSALAVTNAGLCAADGRGGQLVLANNTRTPFFKDIIQLDGSHLKNFDGTLADNLKPRIQAGDRGCRFPQPLSAINVGLEHAKQFGFVRPDAVLAVITIGRADDCSALDARLYDDPTLGPLDLFRCFAQGVVCSPDDPGAPGSKTGCVPREDSAYVRPVADFENYLVSLKGGHDRVMLGVLGADPTTIAVEVHAEEAP